MDPSQQRQGYNHLPYPNLPAVHAPQQSPTLPRIGPGPPYNAYRGSDSPSAAGFSHNYRNDATTYDEDDEDDREHGPGDNKRRRIARACDMCRKKKIKCDGKMPKCSHCENYKTECIFTQVEKKRNPPKGAKYIEGLENRLGRMESLLRMSGLLGEDDGGKTDLGMLEKKLQDKATSHVSRTEADSGSPTSSPTNRDLPASTVQTPHANGAATPATAAETPDAVIKTQQDKQQSEALADGMCSLVTNNCGETRYIGSSSGFSIFSPKGIQWVNEKTGDNSFHDMITRAATDDKQWVHWKPEIFSDLFERKVYKPLPPKAEALALLRDFFENFNCMFPLFHEPTFMHLVDRHYSFEPYEGTGWWASLNVALAIAHRLRVMSDVDSRDEDAKAWGYLKNALSVQMQLTMRNNDLLSVQALLGMALFMQGTPNPHPSFFQISAAIRLAHSIGLHKRGSDFNLNEIESEQRKRVFWIAYLMDKDICLRSGRPPVQDDDDMNVDLPSEDPVDNIGNVPLADGKGKVNLFRLQCVFATIQSKVYKQLYSVKASRQSDGELLNTIGELDEELEKWKDSIPLDFRPEHEIKVLCAPLTLHVVVMHFAYYNCLTTIHRMSVHHGYWTSRLSNYAVAGLNARPLNPRVFVSAALCVNAARMSISLVKYIPRGDHACVWLILYYPVSALVTLFANILQNPQDARARSDLKLMDSVVEFLTLLCQEDNNAHCRRMLSICAEFERIARVSLDKAEREIRGRGKRKNGPSEKDEKSSVLAAANRELLRPTPQSTAPTSTTAASAASSVKDMPTSNSTPDIQHQNLYNQIPYSSAPPSLSYLSTPQAQFPSSSTDQPSWFSPTPAPLYDTSSDNTNNYPFNPDASFNINNYDMNGNDMSLGGGASFQQPFVPQDLWQMPMTLEWDMADIFGLGNMPSGGGGGTGAGIWGMGAGGEGMYGGQGS